VTFDPDTSLTTSGVNLGLTPERVEVEFDLDVTTGTYVASQYDWSPDGESLIYRRNEVVPANLGLWRADNGETGWSETQLITSGGPLYGVHPRWAPDTSNRIAFMTGSGPTDSIEIVDAYDPNDQETIIPAPKNKGRTTKWLLPATWSPSGTHLLYSLVASASGSPEQTSDCYRATADGGDRTNLTGDTGGTAVHQGWQADG
jgi:Tol biopolymer transport system component